MAQVFRSEDFFADVVNAVNDLHIQGFNALEDHIAKQLNLSAQEDLDQLKEAVDAVFVNVQMTVDKSLERWEKYCEDNCFFVPQSAANKDVQVAKSCPTELDAVDTGRQTELDSQLDALRSQILTVRRESSKLSKERQTLEAWLCSKRAKVDAVSRASSFLDDRKLSAIEADICRGAAGLRERMKNAEMEAIETSCLDKKSKAALAKRLQDAL